MRGLLLDADNTLRRWNEPAPAPFVPAFVEKARAMGFALLIVSNAGEESLLPLSEALNIPFQPRCLKPLPFGLLKGARRLGLRPRCCAVVGDQLLTDMPAAYLAGMQRVLLDPLDLSHEFRGTKFNRRVEKVLKRLFRL